MSFITCIGAVKPWTACVMWSTQGERSEEVTISDPAHNRKPWTNRSHVMHKTLYYWIHDSLNFIEIAWCVACFVVSLAFLMYWELHLSVWTLKCNRSCLILSDGGDIREPVVVICYRTTSKYQQQQNDHNQYLGSEATCHFSKPKTLISAD
jgi:hypothetical protein